MVSNSFYRGNPKLTKEKKLEIVKHYLETEGVTLESIAKTYNCSAVSVHKWVKQFKNKVADADE